MKTVYALMIVAICMTGCTWKDTAGIMAGSLAAVAVSAAGGDPMDVGPIEVGVGESATAATDAATGNEDTN